MNVQERTLLTNFLQQLAAAQPAQKDAEAEVAIKEAVTRQPDAAYLLVQRAMQLEHALQAMQAQMASLQAEVEQLRSGGRPSFLDAPNAWGRTAAAPIPGLPSANAQRPAQPAGAAMPSGSTWGSGILGNIASTAAGVVAGSFLFQGIENLLGHRSGSGLWTNPAQDPHVAENTTINNYYYSNDDSGNDDAGTDVADADTDPGDLGDSSDYA